MLEIVLFKDMSNRETPFIELFENKMPHTFTEAYEMAIQDPQMILILAHLLKCTTFISGNNKEISGKKILEITLNNAYQQKTFPAILIAAPHLASVIENRELFQNALKQALLFTAESGDPERVIEFIREHKQMLLQFKDTPGFDKDIKAVLDKVHEKKSLLLSRQSAKKRFIDFFKKKNTDYYDFMA